MTKFVILLGLQLVCMAALMHCGSVPLHNPHILQDNKNEGRIDLSRNIVTRVKRQPSKEAERQVIENMDKLKKQAEKKPRKLNLDQAKAERLLKQLLEQISGLNCTAIHSLPRIHPSGDIPEESLQFILGKSIGKRESTGHAVEKKQHEPNDKWRKSAMLVPPQKLNLTLDNLLIMQLRAVQGGTSEFALGNLSTKNARELILGLFSKFPKLECPTNENN